MYSRTRLAPEQRVRQITFAAAKIAEDDGLYNLSVIKVSRDLPEVSKGTIRHYFKNMTGLRTAVIRYAIDNQIYSIIKQAEAMCELPDGCIARANKILLKGE